MVKKAMFARRPRCIGAFVGRTPWSRTLPSTLLQWFQYKSTNRASLQVRPVENVELRTFMHHKGEVVLSLSTFRGILNFSQERALILPEHFFMGRAVFAQERG